MATDHTGHSNRFRQFFRRYIRKAVILGKPAARWPELALRTGLFLQSVFTKLRETVDPSEENIFQPVPLRLQRSQSSASTKHDISKRAGVPAGAQG